VDPSGSATLRRGHIVAHFSGKRLTAGGRVPLFAGARTPSSQVSERMRRVRVRGTSPELAVRRLLHALGVRFRVQPTDLPGRPDITNARRGWCIFVHGCFWHGHACWRGRLPKKNVVFWRRKIDSNQCRDERVESELLARGLLVVTVWQCELDDPGRLSRRLGKLIGGR
jgi:DNA mismatch endonuclease, patch repair protein